MKLPKPSPWLLNMFSKFMKFTMPMRKKWNPLRKPRKWKSTFDTLFAWIRTATDQSTMLSLNKEELEVRKLKVESLQKVMIEKIEFQEADLKLSAKWKPKVDLFATVEKFYAEKQNHWIRKSKWCFRKSLPSSQQLPLVVLLSFQRDHHQNESASEMNKTGQVFRLIRINCKKTYWCPIYSKLYGLKKSLTTKRKREMSDVEEAKRVLREWEVNLISSDVDDESYKVLPLTISMLDVREREEWRRWQVILIGNVRLAERFCQSLINLNAK